MTILPVFANSFAVNVTPGGVVEMTFANTRGGQMIDKTTAVSMLAMEIERARQVAKLLLQVTDPIALAAQAAAIKASQEAAERVNRPGEPAHEGYAAPADDPDKVVN